MKLRYNKIETTVANVTQAERTGNRYEPGSGKSFRK
jgi:hypothetical protein